MKKAALALILAAAWIGPLAAQETSSSSPIQLAPLFGDHMVLQRDKPLPFWGAARPGAEITVVFRQQMARAKAGADGRWSVELKPETAGGPDVLTVSGGGAVVTVRDVLVGEVWIASGQSNMAYLLNKMTGEFAPPPVAEDAGYRFFIVGTKAESAPSLTATGGWSPITPESAGRMSAVAYFFGSELRAKLNVPVGIVIAAVGGTPASAWTSQQGFEKAPAARDFFTNEQQEAEAAYPAKKERYDAELAAFNERKKQAAVVAPGVKFQEKLPRPPVGPDNPKRPAGLFNGMIHPLIPYAIRGVVWYQGEQDAIADRVPLYAELLRALILDWRTRWAAPDLPFIIVQLPAFQRDINWVRLQLAQQEVAADPGNSLVVTVDLGEQKDVHPRNKRPVGLRAAHIALADVYGLPVAARFPAPVSVARQGAEVRVAFSTGEGRTLAVTPEGAPQGFELAGGDGGFIPAQARVEGSIVVLTSTVAEPVHVRYAYDDWPALGIFDSGGWPAGPFVLPVPAP